MNLEPDDFEGKRRANSIVVNIEDLICGGFQISERHLSESPGRQPLNPKETNQDHRRPLVRS